MGTHKNDLLIEPCHEKTCFCFMEQQSLISAFIVHYLHVDSIISIHVLARDGVNYIGK